MNKGLDYRDFHIVDKKVVYNPKLKQTKKMYEDVKKKKWSIGERSLLWNLMSDGNYNIGTLQTAFESKGYKGLRKVHVDLCKRYIAYNAKEAFVTGKDLTTAKEFADKY